MLGGIERQVLDMFRETKIITLGIKDLKTTQINRFNKIISELKDIHIQQKSDSEEWRKRSGISPQQEWAGMSQQQRDTSYAGALQGSVGRQPPTRSTLL